MKSIVFFVLVLSVILISGTLPLAAFADVISPRQQMKLDFTTEQIICGEGFVKIIKKSTGNVNCVKPNTAERLSQSGWAEEIAIETIQQAKEMVSESVGIIKKIATLKQSAKNPIAGSTFRTAGYAYVFDACAESTDIRAPEIIVTSDSETKSVKLGNMLKANSCYTSSAIIKAADPSSITATLLNKGGISEKVTSLETQIAELKSKISTAKQKIPKSEDQSPDPQNLSDIVTMKKDLKSLQDQLRRYLMVLYVPTNSNVKDLIIPQSGTGKPLEGMTVELVSVTEGIAKDISNNPDVKRWNVVFEACTGKDQVRLPIITVESDTTSVEVKLVNRIISNSCQVGITKVDAISSDSIVPQISGNSGLSKQITELEAKINNIETLLADERSALNEMISKKIDASNQESVTKKADSISKLRADLLLNKSKLYNLLLDIN